MKLQINDQNFKILDITVPSVTARAFIRRLNPLQVTTDGLIPISKVGKCLFSVLWQDTTAAGHTNTTFPGGSLNCDNNVMAAYSQAALQTDTCPTQCKLRQWQE